MVVCFLHDLVNEFKHLTQTKCFFCPSWEQKNQMCFESLLVMFSTLFALWTPKSNTLKIWHVYCICFFSMDIFVVKVYCNFTMNETHVRLTLVWVCLQCFASKVILVKHYITHMCTCTIKTRQLHYIIHKFLCTACNILKLYTAMLQQILALFLANCWNFNLFLWYDRISIFYWVCRMDGSSTCGSACS